MKIFIWLIRYFDKVHSYFRKKKQEQKVRNRIIKTKGTSREEIQTSIEEKVSQEESLTTSEILELAATQTAVELQELIDPTAKIHKRIFDLVEIEQELTALNQKLIEVQINQKQIEPIHFPQNYKTDKDIEKLNRLLRKHDNKQNLVLSTSAINKLKSRFRQFDKFLQERTLVGKYQLREAERAKEFKKFKDDIEARHNQVNKQIEQDDFQSAKSTLRELEVLLKSMQTLSVKTVQVKANLISKTVELKRKLSFRETEIEAKRQAEELKKRQAEALAEEAKRKEETQQKEKEELIQRQQEEAKRKKEEEKKQALQRLSAKKSNWQDFDQVLQENGITTLYHFTDRANIPSIKSYGGLFSWHYCDTNNILIPKTGGDSLSRGLDKRHRLHDYVRLSFCSDHPMQYRLSQSGYNLIVLEVSIDVVFFENTRFSDINAADNEHQQGTTIDDLKRVRFSATKKSYLRKNDPDFKHHQAEVMVQTCIPIKYITNINQF